MTMFLGSQDLSLDVKRRVQIPSSWRSACGSSKFALVKWRPDLSQKPCVMGMMPSLLFDLVRKMNERPFSDPEAERVRRSLSREAALVELDASGCASLLFFWDELERQIRIEGPIEVVSDEEADAYFASRPRGSQIGAWASDQSRECADRETMESRLREVESRYEGQPVPRPPHWIGYRVRPQSIEFWQGGEFRVHDRVVYHVREDGTWSTRRLWP